MHTPLQFHGFQASRRPWLERQEVPQVARSCRFWTMTGVPVAFKTGDLSCFYEVV